MHREQPGEEPREHPCRPRPTAFADHGARGADEDGGPHGDRGPERRLEGGGDGRYGQMGRAGEDRQSAGLPGRSPTSERPCDAPTRVHHR